MLVQGTFPNYDQLIPTTFDVSVKVDAKALRRELRAASVLALQGSGIVRFLIGPGNTLTVTARAEEEGEFEATIPAEAEGEGKIAFNWAYVDNFLKTVGTDAVELRMTKPSAPGLFLPAGEEGYQWLCMPMFVQWDS
jgi:DNA polymerase-3 subunit beta